MPKISIIIPVYNVEKYLARCVDSVLAQTFKDFELILVNDGSADDSGKICDTYADKYPFIHILHQENRGTSAAKNTGIEWAINNSDSEFLTFVDSDDTIKINYLDLLYSYAQENNADVSVCKAIRVFTDEQQKTAMTSIDKPDKPYRIYTGREACTHIYKSSDEVPISPCTKLYKKALFNDIRFPEGKIHEDQAVVPLLIYSAEKVVVADDVIYCYCCNSTSIMGKAFYPQRFDDIDALQSCEDFFRKNHEDEIVLLVSQKKHLLKALYNLKAKQAKFHKDVPPKYKMSIFSAWMSLDKVTKKSWKKEQLCYYKLAPNRFLLKIIGDKNYAKLKVLFKRG